MVKFPTEEGVGGVKGDHVTIRKCYNTSLKIALDSTTLTIGTVHVRSKDEAKGELAEPLEDIVVGEGKVVKIRTHLTHEV
jgi:hypothetical protein